MRRIPVFHSTMAARWRERAVTTLSSPTNPGGQGHVSYAHRQADILDAMGARFQWMWEECRGQADTLLLSQNIPLDLELHVLQPEDGDDMEAVQSMSANAGGGEDETWHDEDQWGVSTDV